MILCRKCHIDYDRCDCVNLLDKAQFNSLINNLIYLGYEDEINWATNITPCDNAETFANEAIWVILNSGMKNQVAQKIWSRIKEAIQGGVDISTAFRHEGKVKAIKYIIENKDTLFNEYLKATDKVAYCETIPFIGGITKWHLAKNLGVDCVKPDRHLVRISQRYNMSADALCERISSIVGEKKSVIDLIIWRACNLKLI